MIIFLCILLFFVILLTLKCTLTLQYSDELRLTLKILFFKFRLLPQKKKRYPHSMSAHKARRIRKRLRKKALKQREKDEEKQKATEDSKQSKKKHTFRDILDIVSLVTAVLKVVLKKTFGHLRLKMTRVKIKIGSEDAATTAIAYGAVSQSINVLFAILSEVKKVRLPKDDELDVSADFLSDKCDIDLDISFSLRVWHILHIACAALIKLVEKMLDKEKKKATKAHISTEK